MIRRDEEGNECTVCQQEFVRGATAFCLPCTHTYHEHCILRWLAHSTSCPMCRLPVLPNDAAAYDDASSPDTAASAAFDQETGMQDAMDGAYREATDSAIVQAVREALFDFEAAAAKLTRTSNMAVGAQACRERYAQAVERWAVTA